MPHQIPDNKKQKFLTRARAGDRSVFDRLRRELEAPVRRFLYRLVGPIPASEEIVQDAFVALYQNLKRIEKEDALLPFLFRVIRNLCYDELKRMGRFQVSSYDSESETLGDPLSAFPDQRQLPHEEAQWKYLYREIRKGIDDLPELQRQALILYSEEDFSYTQIAEAMGTDIGTVKSRIHHARKNLMKNLAPETREALHLHKKIARENQD